MEFIDARGRKSTHFCFQWGMKDVSSAVRSHIVYSKKEEAFIESSRGRPSIHRSCLSSISCRLTLLLLLSCLVFGRAAKITALVMQCPANEDKKQGQSFVVAIMDPLLRPVCDSLSYLPPLAYILSLLPVCPVFMSQWTRYLTKMDTCEPFIHLRAIFFSIHLIPSQRGYCSLVAITYLLQ